VISAARSKFLAATLSQHIARVGLDLLGAGGVTGDAEMAFLWRQSISETIAGGTVEVMLSMIARQALQLGSSK
jgi:alkylation response protein AidB-like acyl-CoA dehydrogenase